MLVLLLIAGGAFLAVKTPHQLTTVALFIVLYVAIRQVGLAVIERSELAITPARHGPATLVRLRDERLRARRQATFECAFLALLGVCAALKVIAPSLLAG